MSQAIHIILFYITTIALAASWVWYTKYQFQDDRGQSEGKWHPYGAFARGLPFVFALLDVPWQHVVVGGIVMIILFDIGVNKIALGVELWYVGKTAKMDKGLGQKKWWIWLGVLIFSIANIFLNKKQKK